MRKSIIPALLTSLLLATSPAWGSFYYVSLRIPIKDNAGVLKKGKMMKVKCKIRSGKTHSKTKKFKWMGKKLQYVHVTFRKKKPTFTKGDSYKCSFRYYNPGTKKYIRTRIGGYL